MAVEKRNISEPMGPHQERDKGDEVMIEWEMNTAGECDKIEDVPNQAHIVAVDDKPCYGRCEGCAIPILEGDHYASDEEGVLLCESCSRECEQETFPPHDNDGQTE
jgi:hypothetical protein